MGITDMDSILGLCVFTAGFILGLIIRIGITLLFWLSYDIKYPNEKINQKILKKIIASILFMIIMSGFSLHNVMPLIFIAYILLMIMRKNAVGGSKF
ncbi:MAG TPA: hypothetical protein DEF04_13575 [Clostridiales bacterium]|nr:hypothetical protein [Clostridiales bacterium]